MRGGLQETGGGRGDSGYSGDDRWTSQAAVPAPLSWFSQLCPMLIEIWIGSGTETCFPIIMMSDAGEDLSYQAILTDAEPVPTTPHWPHIQRILIQRILKRVFLDHRPRRMLLRGTLHLPNIATPATIAAINQAPGRFYLRWSRIGEEIPHGQAGNNYLGAYVSIQSAHSFGP